jgi:hypothetical protein
MLSRFRPIDEELDERINAALYTYRRTYSSATGAEQTYPGLTAWIIRNTHRYLIGRGPDDNDARLRLGQWYITFKLLFPDKNVPDHPCKSLGPSVMIPLTNLCSLRLPSIGRGNSK